MGLGVVCFFEHPIVIKTIANAKIAEYFIKNLPTVFLRLKQYRF